MRSRDVRLAGDAPLPAVVATVDGLAADPAVDGVFVQLPLPAGVELGPVVDAIPGAKDVDGLSASSTGRLVRGEAGFAPCTAEAVVRLLERAGVTVAGQRAVVIGSSPYIALPAAILLYRRGAEVTLADPDVADLGPLCRHAGIVVAAADRAGLVGADHVRPGAAVVDCGVTRTAGGLVGDVDTDAVAPIAGALAPMPGGVGPATIACLLTHTADAARRRS